MNTAQTTYATTYELNPVFDITVQLGSDLADDDIVHAAYLRLRAKYPNAEITVQLTDAETECVTSVEYKKYLADVITIVDDCIMN